MQTGYIFIKDEKNESYASLMHKAIKKLENEVYFPAIKEIRPEYQQDGLWITVIWDDEK